MKQFLNTVITGSGHYLPSRIVKNEEFLEWGFYDQNGLPFDKSNEEIIQKFQAITGIEERRWAEDHLLNSDMAAIAGQKAIEDWGGDKEDIDYIIVANNFGDPIDQNGRVDMVPSMSARVKHKIGINNRECVPYDMIFGCPGWVQGLILGHHLIQARVARNILVIGSETLSRVIDPYDRDKMIFADGAGAVILSGVEDNERYGVLSHANLNDAGAELGYLCSGKSYNPEYQDKHVIRMDGHKIYEYVLKNVPKAIQECLKRAGLKMKDTQKLLIHQANAKMDEAVFLRLKRMNRDFELDSHSYMPMTIRKLGNSSVATVPTLYDLIKRGLLGEHRFHPGDNIVFASVGAGMNINAVAYSFKNSGEDDGF